MRRCNRSVLSGAMAGKERSPLTCDPSRGRSWRPNSARCPQPGCTSASRCTCRWGRQSLLGNRPAWVFTGSDRSSCWSANDRAPRSIAVQGTLRNTVVNPTPRCWRISLAKLIWISHVNSVIHPRRNLPSHKNVISALTCYTVIGIVLLNRRYSYIEI